MKFMDVPIGTEFTFHNQVFVRLNHHENASGKLVNAWLADNPTDDGKLYFDTDVEVAVAEGVRTGKEDDDLRRAAPDLLAACELWIAADKLVNELNSTAHNDACIEAHRATRAAIARARGTQ